MKSDERSGISEAKKAPIKVAFGSDAFSASESTFNSCRMNFSASALAAPKHLAQRLRGRRQIQLISGADADMGLPMVIEAAGAARLNS